MSMRDGMALFKDKFQIFARSEGEYSVRFFGPPYNGDEGTSMKILGHNRDPERLSAQAIVGLLEKFQITDGDFRAAYNHFYSGGEQRAALD